MLDFLQQHLPAWLMALIEPLWRPAVLTTLSVASVLMFVASVLGVPWLVARLPEDYFASHEGRPPPSIIHSPRYRVIWRIAKNVLGVLLLVAGLGMLFLPGQGLITIVMSLLLLEFPGKDRFRLWIVRRRGVRGAMNRMRRRAGRPPLQIDDDA